MAELSHGDREIAGWNCKSLNGWMMWLLASVAVMETDGDPGRPPIWDFISQYLRSWADKNSFENFGKCASATPRRPGDKV